MLDAVHWLAEHEAAQVEYLPVDHYGRVHADAFREAVERNPDDVALATVMWANNEIGTVMPVRELAAVAGSTGSRCTPTPCRPSGSSTSPSATAASPP